MESPPGTESLVILNPATMESPPGTEYLVILNPGTMESPPGTESLVMNCEEIYSEHKVNHDFQSVLKDDQLGSGLELDHPHIKEEPDLSTCETPPGDKKDEVDDLTPTEPHDQATAHLGTQRSQTFDCVVCGRAFSTKAHLMRHGRIHKGERPFSCDVCSKTFTTPEVAKRHQLIHTGEKPYSCPVCGRRFNCKANCVTHQRTHNNVKAFECKTCGRAFSEKSALNIHERLHQEERPYKCIQCDKGYITLNHLRRHQLSHPECITPNMDQPSQSGPTQIQPVNNARQRLRQTRKEPGSKSSKTNNVEPSSSKKNVTSADISSYRGTADQFEDGSDNTCDISGKELRSARNRTHRRTPTGRKSHKCTVCEKGFSEKWILVRHQRIHTGEKPYKCTACGKGFNDQGNYKRHMNIHPDYTPKSGENVNLDPEDTPGNSEDEDLDPEDTTENSEDASFDPDYTPKNFKNDDRPTNSGPTENADDCPEKSRVFPKHKRSLRNTTMKTRISKNINRSNEYGKGKSPNRGGSSMSFKATEMDVHSCDVCEKQFASKRNMFRHRQSHEEGETFKCPVCEKSFTVGGSVSRHLLTHIGEKPYKCAVCGKGFNDICDCTLHQLRHSMLQKNKTVPEKMNVDIPSQRMYLMKTASPEPNEVDVYTCELCDKRFPTEQRLLIHSHSHPGEKLYKCPLCNEGFTVSASVVRHMLTHTETENYTCSICGEGFNAIGSLIKHQHSHKKSSFVQSVQGASLPDVREIPGNIQKQGAFPEELPSTLVNTQTGEKESGLTDGHSIPFKFELSNKERGNDLSILKKSSRTESPTDSEDEGALSYDELGQADELAAEIAQEGSGYVHHNLEEDMPKVKEQNDTKQAETVVEGVESSNTHSSERIMTKTDVGSNITLNDGETSEDFNKSSKAKHRASAKTKRGRSGKLPTCKPTKAPTFEGSPVVNDTSGGDITIGEVSFTKDGKVFICQVCDKQCCHRTNLIRHMRTHTGEKPFQCSLCQKRFADPGSLKRHKRIHTGEKPYKCSDCGKDFSDFGNMRMHQRRIHTGEKPFTCTECGKGFLDRTCLKFHMYTHQGGGPYMCPACGKGFTTEYRLARHYRAHSGEKPYICTYCGKGFSDHSVLKRHVRCHTGEKPYICGVCNKAHSDLAGMRRHEQTHTGERPFLCTTCGKSFASNASLKVHQLRHKGERPHPCGICGKAFYTKTDLKIHTRWHAKKLKIL